MHTAGAMNKVIWQKAKYYCTQSIVSCSKLFDQADNRHINSYGKQICAPS